MTPIKVILQHQSRFIPIPSSHTLSSSYYVLWFAQTYFLIPILSPVSSLRSFPSVLSYPTLRVRRCSAKMPIRWGNIPWWDCTKGTSDHARGVLLELLLSLCSWASTIHSLEVISVSSIFCVDTAHIFEEGKVTAGGLRMFRLVGESTYCFRYI